MPNVFDYLEWRGDLTLEDAPLNEVDALIFCMLSYVDLDGIVPQNPRDKGMTLRAAAAEYWFTHDTSATRPLGFILPADVLVLFRRMAKCARYKDLLLTGYQNRLCEQRDMQFAALTVRLPRDGMFVAFRGTDDSIVGWREDFNLSHMDAIPSQTQAVAYLNALDLTPETVLSVGGHSKGGNLAVWGSVHASESVKRRMREVFCFDGPGFSDGTIRSRAYRDMADRIRVFMPDNSLVGLLLDHDDRYTVVRSSRRGLAQHDGLSWEVLGSGFDYADQLSKRSLHTDAVIKERLQSMSFDERRELVRLMFLLLEATGAKTLSELYSGKYRGILCMLKAYRDMPAEERRLAAYLWNKLFSGKSGKQREGSTPCRSVRREEKARVDGIRISLFPLFLP